MKLFLLASACLVPGTSTQAFAEPVVLTRPHLPVQVRQASQGAGGSLCIVGEAADAQDGPRRRGMVMLFSMTRNRLVWRRTLDAPDASDAHAGLDLVSCQTDGRSVVAGANVDSRGRGLAYVYRFDDRGEVAAVKQLATGAADSFVYAVGLDAGGVTVAGRARDRQGDAEDNAIFLARLDPALRDAAIDRLPTGAYMNGSAARLAGSTVYLGGNFAPATRAARAPVDDYAVSKIVAGKYRFSLRPQRGRAADVATAISPANEIVSLGHANAATHLSIVGADGKLKADRRLGSAFCATRSLGADATAVYAVRALCGDARGPAVLVAIDRATGAELVVSGIVGEPLHVLPLGTALVVIARKSDGSLLLQTLAQGQDPDA